MTTNTKIVAAAAVLIVLAGALAWWPDSRGELRGSAELELGRTPTKPVRFELR